MFTVDTVDIRGVVEVFEDTELFLYFDVTANLHFGNSMDCLGQPFIL